MINIINEETSKNYILSKNDMLGVLKELRKQFESKYKDFEYIKDFETTKNSNINRNEYRRSIVGVVYKYNGKYNNRKKNNDNIVKQWANMTLPEGPYLLIRLINTLIFKENTQSNKPDDKEFDIICNENFMDNSIAPSKSIHYNSVDDAYELIPELLEDFDKNLRKSNRSIGRKSTTSYTKTLYNFIKSITSEYSEDAFYNLDDNEEELEAFEELGKPKRVYIIDSDGENNEYRGNYEYSEIYEPLQNPEFFNASKRELEYGYIYECPFGKIYYTYDSGYSSLMFTGKTRKGMLEYIEKNSKELESKYIKYNEG